MSDHEQHPQTNPDEAHPREGETLPEGAPTTGEAMREKGDVEWEGEKAGKGGDHPTPGAGEHDDPSN